jgi:diguanylate cyclase (GGDEF)-like protein
VTSAKSENGKDKLDEGGIRPASGALDADQTLADTDQTLADTDQTGSDTDQSAAEDDQVAADSDQAASDRDLAHGSDPGDHAFAKDLRERSAEQRRTSAHGRVDAAAARDAVAAARDLAAAARDKAAALHDRDLATQDALWPRGRVAGLLARATKDRKRAAAERAAAAEGRARAAADREQATMDREQAARDRLEGQADREALLRQLATAETDALTGARTRSAGLADVDHEIDRARRTTGRLAVAYVDVVGLKAANDSRGHAVGDVLLQRIVIAIRARLRPYDLIVRLGGDEFLCVMSDATVDDARQRLRAVQAALAAEAEPAQITVGFAALGPDDVAAELIERADSDMLASRPRNRA